MKVNPSDPGALCGRILAQQIKGMPVDDFHDSSHPTIEEVFGWSPIQVVHELSLEYRKIIQFLSIVDVEGKFTNPFILKWVKGEMV